MPDASVELHGSIAQIVCETEAVKDWIEEHCAPEGWQWMGNRLCVEPRYVMPVVEGMIDDGFEVELPE